MFAQLNLDNSLTYSVIVRLLVWTSMKRILSTYGNTWPLTTYFPATFIRRPITNNVWALKWDISFGYESGFNLWDMIKCFTWFFSWITQHHSFVQYTVRMSMCPFGRWCAGISCTWVKMGVKTLQGLLNIYVGMSVFQWDKMPTKC